MQLTGKASRNGLLQRLRRAAARLWLTFRYRLLDRRYGRLVIETIDDVPLIVLPDVFKPVLLRSGAFLARMLAERPLPVGARVLDMGTGSGVGAVFAARKGARVTAVDINANAVRCARINVLLNDLADQVTVVQGDLFEPLAGQRFDLVLFNPPFYCGQPANELDRAWRGQTVFERFSAGLAASLAPGGLAWVVLSSDGQGEQLLALLAGVGFDVSPLASKDLFNEVLTLYEVSRPPGDPGLLEERKEQRHA